MAGGFKLEDEDRNHNAGMLTTLNKAQKVKVALGMLLTAPNLKHVFVHLAHNFFFKLDRFSYVHVGSIGLVIISAQNPGSRPLAEPSGDGALDEALCRARAP